MNPYASPGFAVTSVMDGSTLRVATYNIHKGVRGVGPRKRLEIHNLGLGVEALDADLVFLQEVRLFHTREARHFARTWYGWPDGGQAQFLAPDGYEVAYRTNAITRHGEHGNALLSRWPLGTVGHHDVSDHRFEQRGLLHVAVHWNAQLLHAVVVHFGLAHRSRVRQVRRLADFIAAHVPAGTAGRRRRLQRLGRKARRPDARVRPDARASAVGACCAASDLSFAGAGVRDGPCLCARAQLPLHLGAARHGLGAHVGPPAAAGRAGAGLSAPAARLRT